MTVSRFGRRLSDQGFVGQAPRPGHNVFRRSTGQRTFLGNGAAIYGGESNRIEDCLFSNFSAGCGILFSTTFPTSDADRKTDNNFSGLTVVQNCKLQRCGGSDHSWGWRGPLQICLDRRSIAVLRISQVEILDSFSDGLTVVAPGSLKENGILADARVERVIVRNCGIGAPGRHGLMVREDAIGALTLAECDIPSIQNNSAHFALQTDRQKR